MYISVRIHSFVIHEKKTQMLFGHLARMDETADSRRILTGVHQRIRVGQIVLCLLVLFLCVCALLHDRKLNVVPRRIYCLVITPCGRHTTVGVIT